MTSRRHFLLSAGAATAALYSRSRLFASEVETSPLKEFSYGQVLFAPGLAQAQFEQTQSVLLSLNEDALLKPWRVRAGLPAPGPDLGGWYDEVPLDETPSGGHGFAPGHSFGQWISALSRGYAIDHDPRTRAKIEQLLALYEPAISGRFYTSRVGGGALTRWPPSAAQTVHAVFPHTAFTKTRDSKMQRKGNNKWAIRFTRLVGSGLQYPQTMMYGFFAKRTDPPHHPYSADYPSLPSYLRLPPSPTHSSRRSLGHTAFAALKVIFGSPTTDRASLATSLPLIGSLTPLLSGDSASSPEVTHCSSVPCRPQSPWCGG
jgi:hypothetical protein